jgi:hypothetical protein
MSERNEPGARDSTPATGAQGSNAAATHRPIPPSLLRRLAEAADGAKGIIWFVASYDVNEEGKHEISKEFLSQAAAEAAVQNTATQGVFGPYEAPPAYVEKGIISCAVETKKYGSQQIQADRYDAFFWSESALRKFALPYYANLVGPEYATEIRSAFRSSEVLLMAHDILTEHQMIKITKSWQFLPV